MTADPLADPVGAPILTDYWVDPVEGDDTHSGISREQSLRTVREAWNRIPSGADLTVSGYRIQLAAGDYREEHLPSEGWMESRYGTEQFPVILNSADGPLAARLHRYLNIYDCHYLSLIGLDLITDPGYGGGGNVIHLEASRNILLQGCRLNGFDGTARQSQETLKANQCQYLDVVECDISGAFWFSLDFVAVQFGRIVRSRIHNAGEDALLLKGGSSGFLVEANRIYDAGRRGISAGDSTGFDYMVNPWLHYEIADSKFTNNLIYRTGNAGLAVCGGYNILVAFNTFYRIGLNPIGVDLLDLIRGGRGCEQAAPCLERHALGGWGPIAPGVGGEWIPNRHVYVFNNLFFNPAPLQTVYQHFGFAGPADPPAGSNIPAPSLADEDLRLLGNSVSNGPPDHPLGIGEDSGCQPANPTCNETLILQHNRINAYEPQLMDPEGEDFHPSPDGNVATATSFAIPGFPGGDQAQPPLAPQGELTNSVTTDFNGLPRLAGGPPGALLPASGNIYYVAPQGSDNNPGTADLPWRNPGYGSRLLQPGDTLVLLGGRYSISRFDEDIMAPPDGTPTAWVTIRGETGNRPILAGSDNLFCAIFLSSYLRVENLEITSDAGAPFRGGVDGADHPLQQVVLQDLYIHHIDEGAINVRDVDGLQVRGCILSYCGFGGIGGPAGQAGGLSNLLVADCELSYSGHYYQGGPGPGPYDRPDGFGIEPSLGPVEIVRTKALHNRGDGLDSKSANTWIHECVVANNSCDGVKLWGGGSRVENTLIYGTGDGVGGGSPWAGIVIDEVSTPSARFELINVTIHDNPTRHAYPIYVQYEQPNPIQLLLRNVIISNGYGLTYFGDSVDLTVDHCLFFRPGDSEQIYARGRTYTANEIESGDLGEENLSRDPRFLGPAWGVEGDYHLAADSPALDAGTSQGAAAEDLEGTSRPQGSGYDMGAYEQAASTPSLPSSPTTPVRLVFVHHSSGENWLADGNGGLGLALRNSNYFVSDTNYGWGPGGIGDRTDIGNWWEWFRGPESAAILTALFQEDGQNCSYSRMEVNPDPDGENEVILFKSCFPNSALQGNPSAPIPSIESNPLKGEDSSSPYHTVANAKGIYRDLLNSFQQHPEKLFIAVTAPPLSDPTWAANARAFNQWLVEDWLKDCPLTNVFVLDLYNVLTSNGGSPSVNDLGWESGHHHRWWQGAVQHAALGGGNVNAYPSGDDHPSQAGNLKATG
ncbi:MAG: right-handed parallel beta-helix repeat-containing protein, partial [Coprothermobacterota bacterium]|nr:right-handed parallel beta-helix repeat-containing protein [Coprothermobacterota bacterium]